MSMDQGNDELNDIAAAVSGAPHDPMEQVRELLFGETKRTVEQNTQALEQRLESTRAEFLARFVALENRLNELARDTKHDQAESIETIGSAIAQLGASLQTLGRQRKGG